ncbi:hypothetical protein M8J77_022676 [Diaphorina citri]|nr:hypothetical protein M8J77_022676 [Diaphorina citri]
MSFLFSVLFYLAMAPYSAEVQPDQHPSLSMSSGSFSSSMEMDSDYEANVVLHLVPLPVQLPDRPHSPYDQAIPNILHEVTGAEDLKSVFELKLKVLSSELSLSKLHLYVPQLMILDLSGSYLHSLRDLGCSLTNLKVLKVDRCSLDSLDGVFGLSSVIELSAAYNRIEDLTPAIFLEHLKILNLRGNCIADLSYLGFLNSLPLENLTLAENPAARSGNLYSETISNILLELKILDGKPLTSHLSSTSRHPDCWAFRLASPPGRPSPERPQSARPAVSTGPLSRKLPRTTSLSDLLKESLTEVSFSDSPTRHELCPASRLTSGGIVCGNLTNALRHRNKRVRPPDETGAEEMNVVDVEESTSDAPCAVPSSSEDEPSTSSASNGSMAAHSSDRLIDASRRWRQAFSLFKEKSSASWQAHCSDVTDDASDEDNDDDNAEVSK